jgi:hypothetical protein
MQDDKHRVKLSKEYQEFVVWVKCQKTFNYATQIDKWISHTYADKTTIQLYLHWLKNVKKS